MRLIIAGSRSFDNYDLLEKETLAFLSELGVTSLDQVTIIDGMASSGADKLGVDFAYKYNEITLEPHYAEWDKHGKSAGFIRNQEMANVADAAIVFWDSKSKGSKHMIDTANKKQIPTRVCF